MNARITGRADLWILGGIVVFALVFVVGATWLGQESRTRYALEPLPPLTQSEQQQVDRLGLLTPRYASNGDAIEDQARGAVVRALLQGRDQDAVTRARQLAGDAPRGEPAFLLGLALERVGDRDGALRAYESAAVTLGKDVDLLFRRGRLRLLAGEREAARKLAEEVVSLAPRHPEGQRLLGEACLSLIHI